MKKRGIVLLLCMGVILCGCGVDRSVEPTVGDSLLVLDSTEKPADTTTAALPETQPEYVETEEATQPATTEPTEVTTEPPAVAITKDPTSEVVDMGGRTWFIAHADNDTQITWEIFSPEGILYSADEAMGLNPGLVLEVLPEDTLGLRDIPLSFNGWSARARFDGPGGTAVSERAKITVRDPYEQILEKYHKVWKGERRHWELEVSELTTCAEYIGYTLMDVDGNGVEELVVMVVGNSYDGVICEIYSIKGNEVIRVLESWARSRSYFMTDGNIYAEGSSGAAFQTYRVSHIVDNTEIVSVSIDTSDVPNGLDDPVPHYYYTDASQKGIPISSDEAMIMINGWRSQIWIPELNYIS